MTASVSHLAKYSRKAKTVEVSGCWNDVGEEQVWYLPSIRSIYVGNLENVRCEP